ncbi:hypothetical protein HPP92_018399 [Vanilla planifolia]|uniref:Uncharacterized protein n=1 Tax=Vanilla planifolia TaxID=51239 RepID=A0A835Q9R1_VANPL|nr:hypothetical protein HPP92_018399 [Vanilla planifolia]
MGDIQQRRRSTMVRIMSSKTGTTLPWLKPYTMGRANAEQKGCDGVLLQVKCEEELKEAIKTVMGEKKDCLSLIEVIVHKDDTSKELLGWGLRLFVANSRPPKPQ